MIIESLNFKIIAIQVALQEALSNHILQAPNIQVHIRWISYALLNFGVNT
jgi:hypothetical protein